MRGPRYDLRVLAQLSVLSGSQLRAGWRTALANLAIASQELATPLEGLDPQVLQKVLQVVEQAGLLEEFDWLSPPAAASALYQIAVALPASSQRTRLEARVQRYLISGDAATVVALATAFAQSSEEFCADELMEARVSLCLSLPAGTQIRSERLALALIARPELVRSWLDKPSQGSLPARRLAARILELSARAAARLHAAGDPSGVELMGTAMVKAAAARLLADRESLVWRHAASARGLLSQAVPELAREISASLQADRTPTEWRRGAASMGARIAVAPREAAKDCHALFERPAPQRDPGLAIGLMLGLPRAAEVVPEVVEPLLVPILRLGGVAASEAFIDLLDEGFPSSFGQEARDLARRQLQPRSSPAGTDDTHQAMLEGMRLRLEEPERARADSTVRAAQYAFAAHGIEEAALLVFRALHETRTALARATSADLSTREGRRVAVHSLMELESALLRAPTLWNLVALVPGEEAGRETLEQVCDGLARWLGSVATVVDVEGQLEHRALHLGRVRALLRLLDLEGYASRAELNRQRRLNAVRGLLDNVSAVPPKALRRALPVGMVRGCEALVRDGTFELSDVVFASMLYLADSEAMQIVSEASMLEDLEACLHATAELGRSMADVAETPSDRHECVAALGRLVRALPPGCSPRTTALRRTLLWTQFCLARLQQVASLTDLVNDDRSTLLDELVHSLQELAQLARGARLRLGGRSDEYIPTLGHSMQAVCDALSRAVDERDPSALDDPLQELRQRSLHELPKPLHRALCTALDRLRKLPLQARPASQFALQPVSGLVPIASLGDNAELPDWVPPSQTLGSFYLLRAIGEGGGGSVFAAKRLEDRDDPDAEMVALKVPDYDGDAARALSEQDFLQMFREEAGALLAMPQDQPHLARFVTFDAGVRPKPILVMEYVEGPSLERLLTRRHLDSSGAFDILMGIARGLSSMHEKGIAHLDIKPSNVILRDFWSGAGLEPVLVDFGMSGRRLRPSCCTANYGAPEIWGDTDGLDPRPADVYALGCLIYEVLTGQRLFVANSDVALVSAHMLHDGRPQAVEALRGKSELRPLADCITGCLQFEPSERIGIVALLRELEGLKSSLDAQRWPLHATRPSRTQGT